MGVVLFIVGFGGELCRDEFRKGWQIRYLNFILD
jgi:hypothetical protein